MATNRSKHCESGVLSMFDNYEIIIIISLYNFPTIYMSLEINEEELRTKLLPENLDPKAAKPLVDLAVSRIKEFMQRESLAEDNQRVQDFIDVGRNQIRALASQPQNAHMLKQKEAQTQYTTDQLRKFISGQYDALPLGHEMMAEWKRDPNGQIAKFAEEIDSLMERAMNPAPDHHARMIGLVEAAGVFDEKDEEEQPEDEQASN